MNTLPRRLLPWPRSGAFVRAVFDEDLRRLWFFYREQAFADAEIVDAPIEVDDATGAIDVTVVIDEGPRTIVEAVRAPDLAGLPPEQQELTLRLAPDEPLLPATLEADTAGDPPRPAQRRLHRRDGRARRQRSGRREPSSRRSSTGQIVRGTRQTIGQVIVQGNVETRNEVVVRELPFRSGDPLDPEALRRGQDQVYQLGTYRSVSRPAAGAGGGGTGRRRRGRAAPARQHSVGRRLQHPRRHHRLRRDQLRQPRPQRPPHLAARRQGSVLPDDPSQTQFLVVLAYREPQFLRTPWQWTSELVGERIDPQHRPVQHPARQLRQQLRARPAAAAERRDGAAARARRHLRRRADVLSRRGRRGVLHHRAVTVPGLRRPQRPVRADQRRVRQPAPALRAAGDLDRAARQAQPAAQPGLPPRHAGSPSSTRCVSATGAPSAAPRCCRSASATSSAAARPCAATPRTASARSTAPRIR